MPQLVIMLLNKKLKNNNKNNKVTIRQIAPHYFLIAFALAQALPMLPLFGAEQLVDRQFAETRVGRIRVIVRQMVDQAPGGRMTVEDRHHITAGETRRHFVKTQAHRGALPYIPFR